MDKNINLIIYPVKDINQAKNLYNQLLGVKPYADAPYYVGYRIGGQEIGLDPQGHKKGMTGPVGYWEVADIHKSVQALLDAGAKTVQAVTDVGGGKLIAMLKDPDNNITGLVQNP